MKLQRGQLGNDPPGDPVDHPTECFCKKCQKWLADRGLPRPTTGEDEPDPELEAGAEDEDE